MEIYPLESSADNIPDEIYSPYKTPIRGDTHSSATPSPQPDTPRQKTGT